MTTNRVRQRLRRIHRLVRRGTITAPSDALTRGEEAIDEEYRAFITRINGYLMRHNLKPMTGEEPTNQSLFLEAKEQWARIVADMYGA